MTIIERVKSAIKASDYENDSLNKLIAMAYYMGREDATRRVSDDYTALIAEQNKRADECRYSRMAQNCWGQELYPSHGLCRRHDRNVRQRRNQLLKKK